MLMRFLHFVPYRVVQQSKVQVVELHEIDHEVDEQQVLVSIKTCRIRDYNENNILRTYHLKVTNFIPRPIRGQ